MINNLAILIVTYKSYNIIQKTIKNIHNVGKIYVIENSNDVKFKNKLEKKFPNLNCILTGKNLGFGNALNLVLKKISKNKIVMFLNPDCFIKADDVKKLYYLISKYQFIGSIAPMSIDHKNRVNIRHGYFAFSKNKKSECKKLIKVDYVSGHIFLIRKAILNKLGFFDPNYFMNFEERDLFKKMQKKKYNVFVKKNIYAKHLEGKASDAKFQFQTDYTSKWHFGWGNLYYLKKYYGFFVSLIFYIYYLIFYISKYLYFFIRNEKNKSSLMSALIQGMTAAVLNKKSYYRPKI